MALPYVKEERKQILPTALKEKLRDPQEIAIHDQWRTTEGKQNYPSLALAETKTRFEKQSCRYVQEQPHDALIELLQNYQRSTSSEELLTCTWEDVMRSINTAKAEYAAKATKSKGRAALRSRPAMKTLHMLTNVIPEEKGLSALRGGLTLAFKLIERRIENQEKILRTLEDVPLRFEEACHRLASYHYDPVLVERVQEYYFTLVKEIVILIEILLRKTKASGSFKGKFSLLKRSHPEQEAVDMEKALDLIDRMSRAVDVQIEYLRDQKLSNIEKSTSEIREAAKEIPREISEGVRTLNEQSRQYRDDVNTKLARIEEAVVVQTSWFHFFTESLLLQRYQSHPLPLPERRLLAATTLDDKTMATQDPLGTSPFVSVGLDQIFAAIGIDPALSRTGPNIGHVGDDLEVVLREVHQMQEGDLRRSQYLPQTPRFQHWFEHSASHPQSDIILVNGYSVEDSHRSISPLSVFSASLVSTIIRQFGPTERYVVLHHFCTLHTRSPDDDGLAGPVGLLRRLIAQLAIYLAGLDMHTRLLDRELFSDIHAISELEDDKVNLIALCELLGCLLNEVPEGVVVFIIIDNVSDFEVGNWRDDMTYVAWRLRGIGRSPYAQDDPPHLAQHLKAMVRIMMTFSMRSIAVFQKHDIADCISLEAEHEYEGDMTVW